QMRKSPCLVLTGRKSLAEEYPLLPQCLPRCDVLWINGRFFREPAEARNRIFQERPELGRIYLLQRMHANLDLLPRPAERLHLHPRLVAVDRQVSQLIEC